jgi:hypothetical protein
MERTFGMLQSWIIVDHGSSFVTPDKMIWQISMRLETDRVSLRNNKLRLVRSKRDSISFMLSVAVRSASRLCFPVPSANESYLPQNQELRQNANEPVLQQTYQEAVRLVFGRFATPRRDDRVNHRMQANRNDSFGSPSSHRRPSPGRHLSKTADHSSPVIRTKHGETPMTAGADLHVYFRVTGRQ